VAPSSREAGSNVVHFGWAVRVEDDERVIALQSAPWSRAGEPSYSVVRLNNAYINDAYVLEKYADHSGANHLSYEYCENMLQDKTNPSAIPIEEGIITCVKTTEGKIALSRAEKIYLPYISVGFICHLERWVNAG
jgi:hypothetical protein